MKNKAVVYCRVSSEKQVREGHGLEGQEKRCRDYAKYHQLHIEQVFRDEGVSGGIIDRSGIQALLHYISTNGGNYRVIVDDINRFARDVVAHFTLKKAITNTGSELLCVNMKLENNPEGEFIETLMAASAQLERTRNRQQVCNRMKSRMEMGYWTFDCPPGYKYVKGSDGGKVLILDERKANIVKEALEGFATGKFLTQSDVQQFLTTKRFCHKGEFKRVHPQQVKRLLTKPLYAGIIHYPAWQVNMVQGKHPAIISLTIYNKIQERLGLKANNQFTRKSDNYDFPIRGFALCPECKKPYTSNWSKGRSNKYPYYRCNNKECQISPKSIKRETLEDILTNALKDIRPTKQIISLAKEITLNVYNKHSQDRGVTLADFDKEAKQLDQEIKATTDKFIKTTSPAVQQALESRIEELDRNKQQIQLSIDNLSNNEIDFETAFNAVISFIENPYDLWVKGDLKQKKLVQRLVFINPIVIHPSKLIGTANLSFPFKMLRDISDGKIRMVDVSCENWNRFNSHILEWAKELLSLAA